LPGSCKQPQPRSSSNDHSRGSGKMRTLVYLSCSMRGRDNSKFPPPCATSHRHAAAASGGVTQWLPALCEHGVWRRRIGSATRKRPSPGGCWEGSSCVPSAGSSHRQRIS